MTDAPPSSSSSRLHAVSFLSLVPSSQRTSIFPVSTCFYSPFPMDGCLFWPPPSTLKPRPPSGNYQSEETPHSTKGEA